MDEEVLTYRPTFEQFKNLSSYIESLEKKGAHIPGILKIIPPKEWVPRRHGYDLNDMDFDIEAPIEQKLTPTPGKQGVFRSSAKKLTSLSPKSYAKLSQSPMYVTPSHASYEDLEGKYWDSQNACSAVDPIYGADVNRSLVDQTCKVWNVSKLESILSDGIQGGNIIPGVNDSYLYFGMWRATFSWHVEDMDLYSTNYLHFGAPKTWYCVPPSQAHLLERVAGQLFPDWKRLCPNFMRHKICMINPTLLRRFGITVNKLVQEERNFIVVFPHAFHAGFNHGFNIAEAANFALPRWIEYGKRFRSCCCSMWVSAVDGMRLSMDYFVKTYQPDRYLSWRVGKDYGPHPEDPAEVKAVYQCLDMDSVTPDQEKRLKRLALVLDLEGTKELECSEEKQEEALKNFHAFSPALDLNDYSVTAARVNLTKYPLSIEAIQELLLSPTLTDNKENCPVTTDKENHLVIGEKKEKKNQIRRQGYEISKAELERRTTLLKCKKKHRIIHCKKCDGCTRKNCGDCVMCLDMPRFGGTGRSKKKCVNRVCTNPKPASCSKCEWNIA